MATNPKMFTIWPIQKKLADPMFIESKPTLGSPLGIKAETPTSGWPHRLPDLL